MNTKQIDWRRIIVETNQHLSMEKIALEIEIAVDTLYRLKHKNVDPKYSIGVALIELYRTTCGKNDTPIKK